MDSWVEQDPDELISSVKVCIDEACREIRKNYKTEAREMISAIGITNQRETSIAWDSSTGRSLCNAIGTFQYISLNL